MSIPVQVKIFGADSDILLKGLKLLLVPLLCPCPRPPKREREGIGRGKASYFIAKRNVKTLRDYSMC